MSLTLLREVGTAASASDEGLWYLFQGGQLLLQPGSGGWFLPRSVPPGLQGQPLALGTVGGHPLRTLELPQEAPLPSNLHPFGLREAGAFLSEAEWGGAAYAVQILHWQRTARFCPACGQPTRPEPSDWGRRCKRCDFVHYPRVSPCVIVLIHDGSRVLMVRQPSFPQGMYGLVAGFIEPGESLEAGVHREVQEEVGLAVSGLRYFGSQPWPFPHQLMVGFIARYAGGTLRPDTAELEQAAWFDLDALPGLPPRLSIARQLIDHFKEGVSHDA